MLCASHCVRRVIGASSGFGFECVTSQMFADLSRQIAALVNVRPVGVFVEMVQKALIKLWRAEAFVVIATVGPASTPLPSPPKIRIFIAEMSFCRPFS